MIGKEFFNKVANSKEDFLQAFINLLAESRIRFCVIGGLAVNAYVDPVVSLDLDLVVVAEKIDVLVSKLKKKFKVEMFVHSINISDRNSDLRVQIQIDPRYQSFLKKARTRNVLGYRISVAAVEDILQGKIWAALDQTRRPSKRQKDMADILRLLEAKPRLKKMVPAALGRQLLGG